MAGQTTTPYRDRETGKMLEERVFGGSSLEFLYHHWLGKRLARLVVGKTANQIYGLWQRSGRSRKSIPEFVRSLGIDSSEAELPMEHYPSMDAFFCRRLKPAARPIDTDAAHLIAPCDGRLLVFPQHDGTVPIKSSQLDLWALLEDQELAARYAGGDLLVFRLAPADYHRFHFPASGTASSPSRLGKHLHSVHSIALAGGAPSFVNFRMITRIQTEQFAEILQIEIGALLVGSIEQHFSPGRVERGQDKGTFRFGGSTVVVAVQPGKLVVDEDLCEASRSGIETFVKMGTRVGTAPLRGC